MNRNERVIKTTLIYFVGNFASKILGFILLPLYTTYLTKIEFGTVDILMSTLPLIAPIFTMQVTESVFRFLMTGKSDNDRKMTITNALAIFMIGFIVFIFLYLPLLYHFGFNYGILFLLYYLVTYIGVFLQQVLRGLQKTVDYAVTGVISTVVHVVLNIFLLTVLGLGGEALLLSSIAGSMVIIVYAVFRTRLWIYIDIHELSKTEINRQLKFGLPLIPNQIAWWVIGLLGKYILLYYHGVADNGVLAVASKFPNLLTIVSAVFLQAWTENVIKEYNSQDRDIFFKNGLMSFTIFMISTATFLLPIIKIYNILTIKGDFENTWKFIPILIIGSVFNSLATFLGTIYTASTKTRMAFTTTIIAALSNLLLSLILIPKLNIWGVVISNMMSFIVFYFARIKSVNSIIKLEIDFREIIPSLVLLIISIFVYYCLNTIFQIFSIMIFGVSVLYLNRKIVVNVFNYATRKN